MDAWTSGGMQNTTPEGVVVTCLLCVGCGQLINCPEPGSGAPLILRSWSSLGDFEQETSILSNDKNLRPCGNIPMPTLHTY